MNLDRQLARLMAAVIVMIAAYVLPSAAQAHEGHAHSRPSVTVSHAQAAPAAALAKPAQFGVASFVKTQTVIAAVASSKSGAQTTNERPCNGICCSMGMSCCAPALIPDNSPVNIPEMTGVQPLAPETPSFASITLEALPKPPKSFA